MDQKLKQRLVGATVLVSLMVIFVPMVVEDASRRQARNIDDIPPRPEFAAQTYPLPSSREELILPPQLREPAPAAASRPLPESVDKSEAPGSGPAAARGERNESEPSLSPTREPIPQPSDSANGPKPETGASGVRAPVSSWVLQAGSFSTQDKADKLSAQLRVKGFPAFVEGAQIDGKTVYRVRVGPELDRKRATTMQERLRKQFKLDGMIVRYP